jgi:hypothetical protein
VRFGCPFPGGGEKGKTWTPTNSKQNVDIHHIDGLCGAANLFVCVLSSAGVHILLHIGKLVDVYICQGHFANEFVSGSPAGFTGVLDISSPIAFAALTMRSRDNERQESLAALFPNSYLTARDASAPLVFPQIVDGGG